MRPGELAELEFFRGMSDEHLDVLSRYSKRRKFKAGSRIYRQGELANCFHVLKSGHVQVEFSGGGSLLPLQILGPGQPLGFSWLYDPPSVHFSAHALDDVDTVFFYGALLREESELDSSLGCELFRRIGRVMVGRIESLAGVLAKALAERSAPPAG